MSDLEKMSESVNIIIDENCRPDADDMLHTIPKTGPEMKS